MIDRRQTFFVELRREVCCAHCHADAVSKSLAQWTSRDLNSGRKSVLRMTGRFRTPLAKVFQFVERQVVAGQMQQRIEQHRSMARRKQKTISIFPLRIARVVTHEASP